MKNIHLKTALAIAFLILFVACAILTICMINIVTPKANIEEWVYVVGALLGGFVGARILKETYEDNLYTSENHSSGERLFSFIVRLISKIILAIAFLLAYVVLWPLYLLYFIGYILGKGMQAAKSED